MQITVLAFGIVKDIVHGNSIEVSLPEKSSVADLKSKLETQFPQFQELKSYVVAVNNEYASDSTIIKGSEEVAIIPPVSGG